MRAVRVVRALASVVVWVVAFGCFAFLVAVGIGPRTGRYSTLTVLSGSMRPGIPEGSVVLVTPERPDQVRVGQILTYAIPEGDHHVVSHRVIEIVQGGAHPVIRTRGDANNTPDPWVAQINGDTAWHVRFAVPAVGQAIHWLRRPLVHKVSVLVSPALLAVVWLVGIWRTDAESGLDLVPVTAT